MKRCEFEGCNGPNWVGKHTPGCAVQTKLGSRFEKLCKHPLMWAGTREALVAMFSTLLDLNGKDGHKLFDLFPKQGCAVLTLGDQLDDQFAEQVINMAQQLWMGSDKVL